MSVLPLNQINTFLDVELRKVVLWNNEFIRKTNEVSFPSGVGDVATSLDLKLDMLISNILTMNLSYMRLFSYGKNIVACIYLNIVNISLVILYPKINDWFHGYENMSTS